MNLDLLNNDLIFIILDYISCNCNRCKKNYNIINILQKNILQKNILQKNILQKNIDNKISLNKIQFYCSLDCYLRTLNNNDKFVNLIYF